MEDSINIQRVIKPRNTNKRIEFGQVTGTKLNKRIL